MTQEQQAKLLSLYEHALNSIDDLLEYHYRAFSLEELRLEILGYIEELAAEIEATIKQGSI